MAMLVAVAVEGKRRNILKKEIIYSKFRAGPLNLKEKKNVRYYIANTSCDTTKYYENTTAVLRHNYGSTTA